MDADQFKYVKYSTAQVAVLVVSLLSSYITEECLPQPMCWHEEIPDA